MTPRGVVVASQSDPAEAVRMNVSLSPSPPRWTGDTGHGGPLTGDKPVIDREQTGDGVLAHPMVQRALELFDGEVIQVRPATPRGASRAA